ncbi:MAG: hypothetical protein MK198_03225 [Gracilimonas sp.]|uniref:hypothetical protein n=1 Tax=Gracilimonas sp. TaxID=1974203 RepID=UPI003752B404|nr:hypothetical protein [Gracilimonas sp.]
MYEKVEANDIIRAAKLIDKQGYPREILNGQQRFWVSISEGREYPFKELTRRAVEISTGEVLDFSSTERIRDKFRDKFPFKINEYKEGINFFTEHELDIFSKIAGSKRRAKPEYEPIDNRFLPTFYRSNKWAELIQENLPSFVVEENWNWQSGTSYKRYSWHTVYKKGDKGKKIFFTIGVDGDGFLIIKLDCMRESRNESKVLAEDKIERFKNYRSGKDWKRIIYADELSAWSWDKLINHTVEFISLKEGLYDEAIKFVYENSKEAPKSDNESSNEDIYIPPVNAPEKIKSRIPKERNFEGREINWEREFQRAQETGIGGEEFIIKQEKLKLINAGLQNKAELVEKELDGTGFDIRSFNEDGEEIETVQLSVS